MFSLFLIKLVLYIFFKVTILSVSHNLVARSMYLKLSDKITTLYIYFVLINIIFLIINLLFYLFFTIVPCNSCVFLSCRPFVVNTFSIGFVGVKVSSVSCLGSLACQARRQKKLQHPQDLLKMSY